MRSQKFYIARLWETEGGEVYDGCFINLCSDGSESFVSDSTTALVFATYNEAMRWLDKRANEAREKGYENVDRYTDRLTFNSGNGIFYSYKIVAL